MSYYTEYNGEITLNKKLTKKASEALEKLLEDVEYEVDFESGDNTIGFYTSSNHETSQDVHEMLIDALENILIPSKFIANGVIVCFGQDSEDLSRIIVDNNKTDIEYIDLYDKETKIFDECEVRAMADSSSYNKFKKVKSIMDALKFNPTQMYYADEINCATGLKGEDFDTALEILVTAFCCYDDMTAEEISRPMFEDADIFEEGIKNKTITKVNYYDMLMEYTD